MKTVPLREAKSSFSALVDAAECGQPTVVTRHGRPAAMIVPITEGRQLYPDDRPSFAELLLAVPDILEFERDPAPMRAVEL